MINLAQASSGSGDDSAPEMVVLSQNETESLCMKAARGAGFSWGLAEEAGFAAGWLAARGIDASTPLLSLLMEKLGQSRDSGTPTPLPAHWRCKDQEPLCPIILGASLIDCALLADGPFSRDTKVDPVATPLLLLPFLARSAQICGKHLMIDWQDGCLEIAANGTFDCQAAVRWQSKNLLAMTIRTVKGPETLSSKPTRLPAIPIAVLNGLTALALRTTVPTTDASRRGAGSSTFDND